MRMYHNYTNAVTIERSWWIYLLQNNTLAEITVLVKIICNMLISLPYSALKCILLSLSLTNEYDDLSHQK